MKSSARVAIANLTIPSPEAMIWGAGQHEDFLSATGYQGLELHPIRRRLLVEILLGRKAIQLITSQHQSFRGERLRDMLTTPHPSVIALPRRERSLAYMALVQKKVAERIPAVLYPTQPLAASDPNQTDYPEYRHSFGPRLLQPTAEVLRHWQIETPEVQVAVNGMLRVMHQKGYDGLCIDTHHWFRDYNGARMPSWQDALPLLAAAGAVDEIHFGPARPDLHDDSSQLVQVLTGHADQTESGQMVRLIKEHQPPDKPLYVVTEILPVAISSLGYKDCVAPHREIVAAIDDLIAA